MINTKRIIFNIIVGDKYSNDKMGNNCPICGGKIFYDNIDNNNRKWKCEDCGWNIPIINR